MEYGEFEELVQALREVGLAIPDECQDFGHLIIAVKASGRYGMGGPPRRKQDNGNYGYTDDEIDTMHDGPEMLLSATRRGGRSRPVDPKVLATQEQMAKDRSIPAKK
jgi:hypothetical protein